MVRGRDCGICMLRSEQIVAEAKTKSLAARDGGSLFRSDLAEMGLSGAAPLPLTGLLRGRCKSRRSGRAGQAPPLQRRALHLGLGRGIQKLQDAADALGPSGFVVLAALDALVVQIFAQAPAFFYEHVAKLLD